MRLVKPITRTRGSPAKRSLTRSRSCSLRPQRQSTSASSATASAASTAPVDVTDTPAAAGDGDHGAVLPAARALRARRARERGARNAGEVGGLAQRTLPGPGDPLDLLLRLGVRDEVQIDPRMRPEAQTGEVRDR